MTIHHDKLAYGKLASQREEISEEKLAEMLKALKEEDSSGTVKPPEGKAVDDLSRPVIPPKGGA